MTHTTSQALRAAFGSSLPRIGSGPQVPAGTKLRGANLVPKPNGPKFGGGTGPQGWGEVWSEWDWAGWIKPQVDAAKSAGANVVRMIGAVGAVLYYSREGATARAVPQATYLARWRQLIEYCRAQGMRVYPTGGDFRSMPAGGAPFTQAELVAALRPWLAVLEEYTSVVGVDVIQEAFYDVNNGVGPSGVSGTAATHTYLAAVAAGIRSATSLPLTFSQGGDRAASNSDLFLDFGGTLTTLLGYADYLDFHVYYDAAPADMAPAVALGRPVVIGEIGAPMSLGTAGRVSRLTAGAELAKRAVGAFVWAITDQDTASGNQWGLYDATFAARSSELAAYRTWPTTASATPPFIVPAQQMSTQSGSPALGGGTMLFDAAAEEVTLGFFSAPPDWTTYNVDLRWVNASTGTGDVVWRYDRLALEPGTDWTATTGGADTTATAGAGNIVVETRLAAGVSASGTRAFKLRRRAAVAGDTLPNDAGVLALIFTKAS